MTQPTVAVTGVAQREIAPDTFTLTVQVERRAATSADAYAALATACGEVEAELATWPVRIERDIVRGHPDHDHDGRMVGWVVFRVFSATGRDLDRVADLAGALGRLTDVGVGGPHWAIDDDNPAHDELQADAVHAARARAQRYAAALDGTLGALVELSDPEHHVLGKAMRFDMMSAGVPESGGLETLDFSPRPVSKSATVQARWYLVLGDAVEDQGA